MPYTKITNYLSKDALLKGDPAKVIRGSEINADFDAVSAASVADDALYVKLVGSQNITGVKTLTTAVLNGTITGTSQATANTISTLVMRDASGNFAAGTITANAVTATTITASEISATELISANKGIVFPVTQVASADPNTLDDYEEGTWTPSGTFSTSNGNRENVDNRGRYTKIGNMVTVYCYTQVSKGTATGNYSISGLPFSIVSPTIIGFGGHTNNFASVSGAVVGYIEAGSTEFTLYQTVTGTASIITNTQMATNNTIFACSFSYST